MGITTAAQEKRSIRTFRDLEVYQEGFRLAMEIFQLTKQFPKEELYGLAAQMRSASRSIPANIAEGWARRRYVMVFKRQLLDAIGSVSEMLVWLDTAHACGYLTEDAKQELSEAYERLGRRLHQLVTTWKTFS
jgi:four helix bundle protein